MDYPISTKSTRKNEKMANNSFPQKERDSLSLLELNQKIKRTLEKGFLDNYWIKAEMSDVRVNASSGHCYLEFVEKEPLTGQLVAKVRGTIWARVFRMLKPYFESETGQLFTSGIKVLVLVSVEFHEVYGLNLTVLDIDPTYTLGDIARRRLEIINKLKEDGIYEMNKELPMPLLPQRIAIITSPTAAGYEDFLDQLRKNKGGYVFYTKLFPAIMQGNKTEESIIAALDRIFNYRELFDVVVIIRGGGATSDLNSFDSYPLAANCAQFPLPIITGIGHERDDTIVDLVAHTRLKTPTAVAEYLISCLEEEDFAIQDLKGRIISGVIDQVRDNQKELARLYRSLPALVKLNLEQAKSKLKGFTTKIPFSVSNVLVNERSVLERAKILLHDKTKTLLMGEKHYLINTEQFLRMASPEYILKRGYSLTTKNGKIITRANDIAIGDKLTIRFFDGDVISKVEQKRKKQE